jgi:hypothetical protein
MLVFIFIAGFATAVAPSMIALLWMMWAGGIGEDPRYPSAEILPFVKGRPKRHAEIDPAGRMLPMASRPAEAMVMRITPLPLTVPHSAV